MKFNKVLHPGRNNPRHQYRSGVDLLGSSAAESPGGQQALHDQQRALVAKKANGVLGCMEKSVASRHLKRGAENVSPPRIPLEPKAHEATTNEFRPWVDVKPVKAIKAKAQYKPPEEKMTHETSYSAQFKGETSKPAPADNKFLERRRIRTLYSEPYKEPPKVEKPSVKPSKPKKTATSHKPLKKAKDKQITSGRAAKKKSAETSNTAKPEDKEKSKEMNNKLAEAKE
ncbi:microtubule-associated protein 6 [Grus japonensis]|uniref:Microtubule-associated protein 6 n=1 Tax=Grus japonensis TaxID=30415 RepID=A0ABC9W726_GRUJA